MRILLVEDDIELATELRHNLQKKGYAVDMVHDGAEASFMGVTEPYDAVILDLGLPNKNGLEVLIEWRASGMSVPVLILTARGAWYEKVEGFRAGADDYLSKPFHTEELLLRMQALIRRSNGAAHKTLQAGILSLDEEGQFATLGEKKLDLTAMEFRLLRYFMLHPDKILSEPHLLEHVYDHAAEKESNIIEVYISRLRKKMGKKSIRTRRGQGYVFDPTAICIPAP
ncbi:MAG: response regulator transcription factor [Mariprofundaceae bacterium]|nr:response regulator transcription factor [Mariprofundaceae bacterium]